MTNKVKIAIGIGLAAVLCAAGYFLFLAGPTPESEATEAFKAMAAAMAGGNKGAVSGLVSKKFNDAGMSYAAAVEELSIKRPGYRADLDGIAVNGQRADLSYTRKETVDKKLVVSKITKETWEKETDGKWRLVKFSAFDRTNLPKMMAERQEKEARAKAELASAEAAKLAARSVAYAYAGKRDPFESLIIEGKVEEGEVSGEDAKKCDPGRKREYLEGFDASTFKIAGIVYSEGYYALLEAQNGHGYTVKPGMYIGKRCGKITDITADKIVVAEKFMTPRGTFDNRQLELTLRAKEKVE